ncbi:hypothetical protein CPAST_c37920 [Clostridium pasteurianum DSM 525 = ATCC 6013]|uniref:Lipoprotein n=1 Tax=Clostridium pasteurianum DSM 525 = ATCC 6013 TaxID=1262449 RepID=A0A0H3JBJ3_CLOPA|nr:hypothetical protein [Clostridium pasteurianum]AJA49830.1 hypothetical protein CPAST_c37920 [Clostridium pasteurianum DSM 525 = ATCC 6013]AJA53818.1 hypothetical protein CLPA_c37920 [Clostridium pasteurianum DSM 525 = ATCC 6013]AOZ76975.1 hypothetical protein AQ983_18440 [Clostridium pasteurianum DSM 525 = ATCC 6013]AOZ80772.1 hypothetical protein AQ984_18435 [Clostridium pasteurianum]ELP57789.1 hypothetical protein F502_17532 [Clostridium pasteurianum DSM 525 = ATCC 6013]
MKKIFLGIICICIFISSVSCSKSHVSQTSELKEFDIAKAFGVVNKYMTANMKNDIKEMSKFYSSTFKKDNVEKMQQDVIINGYKFDEVSQAQDMADIYVRVTKINSKIPYSSLEIQNFKVIREKGEYKIKSIDIENQSESFESYSSNNLNSLNGRQIRIRFKNAVKTNLVTNMQSIPRYYYTQDDKAKIDKIPVGLKDFGISAMSYDGTSQIITTKGDNPFIEIVHFDESMATQGGTGDSQSSGGGGNGTGTSGESEMQPETPIGKEIRPIDVIPGANIKNLIFSQDEIYMAVQYSKANLGNSIRVYLNKNGKIISFKFEDNYPMDKVNVDIINFVEEGLVYKVTPKNGQNNDNSIKNMVGTWQLDMEEYKPKKVNESDLSSLKK